MTVYRPTFVAILFLSDSSVCSLWEENPSIDCSRERRSILILWVNFWNHGNETLTQKWDSISMRKCPRCRQEKDGSCASVLRLTVISWPKATAVISLRQTLKSLQHFRMSVHYVTQLEWKALQSQWAGGLPARDLQHQKIVIWPC